MARYPITRKHICGCDVSEELYFTYALEYCFLMHKETIQLLAYTLAGILQCTFQLPHMAIILIYK